MTYRSTASIQLIQPSGLKTGRIRVQPTDTTGGEDRRGFRLACERVLPAPVARVRESAPARRSESCRDLRRPRLDYLKRLTRRTSVGQKGPAVGECEAGAAIIRIGGPMARAPRRALTAFFFLLLAGPASARRGSPATTTLAQRSFWTTASIPGAPCRCQAGMASGRSFLAPRDYRKWI